MNDAQIDAFCTSIDLWYFNTFNWLYNHVSEYAAERFAFQPTRISLVYNAQGTHAAGYVDKWGRYRETLSTLLGNLDQLMRDPSAYPNGIPK
jgi:hypothetical protein